MLTFLPLFLLLLIVLLVEIISRSKLNIGNQWLILILAVTLVLGSTIFLRAHLPTPIVISNWLEGSANQIVFQLDDKSWVFIFGLVAFLSAMMFMDTIHLHERSNLRSWSRIILLFCMGVLGALANSLMAFILVWTIIDVVELIVHITGTGGFSVSDQSVIVFFAHLVGTFLILPVLVSHSTGTAVLSELSLAPQNVTLLILSSALRMPVYDGKNLSKEKEPIDKALQSLRQILFPYLAMVLLARLPEFSSLNGFPLVILILASCIVIVASFSAFDQKNNKNVLMVFSGLSVISVLRGDAEGVIGWAILMLVLLGLPQIFTYQKMGFIPMIALIGFSAIGLPISISNSSILSLSHGSLSFFNIFIWIGLAYMLGGMIQNFIKPSKEKEPEAWMIVLYTIGVVIISFLPWFPGFWGVKSADRNPFLWQSIVIFVIAFTIILIRTNDLIREKCMKWLPPRIQRGLINGYRSPDRAASVYRLVDILYEIIQQGINTINKVLEGEGGLLWAFVLLVLLLSLLMSMVGG